MFSGIQHLAVLKTEFSVRFKSYFISINHICYVRLPIIMYFTVLLYHKIFHLMERTIIENLFDPYT